MLSTLLPSSRSARRILIGGLFSAIGRGLTLPFLLIYLTEVRGLDAATVGLLVGWMGLVALLLAPLGGFLVDRLGARPVVLTCLGIECVGTASLALVHDRTTAFVVLTVAAIGGAALWSGQTTILASLVSDDERQRAFGLSFTLLNLGIGVGGLIAGAFVDVARPATFEALYFGDAASYLVPAAILLSLPGVGRRLVVASAPDQRATTSSGPARARSGGGSYREVLRNRPFVQFILFGLVLTTCGYAQIEIGFTAFAIQVAEVSPRVVGWALAANTLLIVSLQLLVLRVIEGRSRARALSVTGLVFALSWLALAAAGLAGGRHQPAWAAAGVIASSVIFAMGETLLAPVMPAITNALATDEARGRYNAVGSMVWGVSGIAGPVAAGPLIGRGHATAWVVMVVAGSLLAAALAVLLRRRLTPAQDGRVPVRESVDGSTASGPVDGREDRTGAVGALTSNG